MSDLILIDNQDNQNLLLENTRLSKALAVAELHFSQLTAQLNEVIFIMKDGFFTFLSPAWETITGVSVEQSLNTSIQNYIHFDDINTVWEQLSTADIFPVERQIEFRIIHKNRQVKWVALTAQLNQNQNASIDITGTLRDITNHVITQQALTESEERYELVASSFNDGIWDWDLVSNDVYLSPRWKEMLGYRPAELPNALTTWTSLVHPDDLETALETIKHFLESPATFYQSIHRLKHKQGEWVWILARGIAVRDKSGKASRIYGSHTDVTLLRNVEEALLQRERELSDIVTISPDGIVTFTPENKVSSVNPAFLTMTGFQRDDLLLISKDEFDQKMMMLCDSKKPYKIAIENAVPLLIEISITKKETGRASEQTSQNLKFNFSHNQPPYRILRLTQYYLNNATTAIIMYFRDVTLEIEMDRMKSEFLSVVAHELRTPISSIYGYSELLINREFDNAAKRDVLQAIYEQCTGLVNMINELLDLARMETRSQQFFHFELHPLITIIKETISSFKMCEDLRKIEAYYFVDESSLIYADKNQIKRALLNVLSNAFKYSPNSHNIILEVQLRTSVLGEAQIGVTVEDKGIGIRPNQVSHIFDRFWRADNVGDIIGTGLGMALVKEIIDFHHGEIEVQSVFEQGTKIGLWLPLHESQSIEKEG